MNEWRYQNPNLPSEWEWPSNPEDALNRFIVNPKAKWVRNMMPGFIDQTTGIITAWHFSEDFHGGDVYVIVPAGYVLEGYTANETLDSKDDRTYVIYGGDQGIVVELKGLQGFTIYQPGTEPNSVALRTDSYEGSEDHPHYLDENGNRVGADPIGFPPAYPAPENNG